MTRSRVLIVGATHGNERVGVRVINALRPLVEGNNDVDFLVANPRALEANRRFLETDLNRSFPGNPQGAFEERLAYDLQPLIASYNVVVDIHSTSSGLKSAVIVKKVSDETISLVQCTNAKYVLHMDTNQGKALISGAKVGIAFEYGADNEPETEAETFNGICLILQHLGHLRKTNAKSTKRKVFFHVSSVILKPEGFLPLRTVKNYKVVVRGQPYAMHTVTGEVLVADENFYPILFGENSYKDIFGFRGYRVSKLE